MAEKPFKIYLDPALINSFEELVNTEEHISTQKLFNSKKYRDINAWDCICACITRIKNTIQYLNDLELGSMNGYGNAFDFADFMNNATVVVSCVDTLANIFGESLDEPNSHYDIFCMRGEENRGTDKDYFEFIRSLCVVHPDDTSHHQQYSNTKLVTCPSIVWTKEHTTRNTDNCDLRATVYINDPFSLGPFVEIYIDQIFKYVSYRYSLLKLVNDALYKYQQSVISDFEHKPVLAQRPTETVQEYILRLKSEDTARFGVHDSYIFDFVYRLMEFQPTNPKNKQAIERYKNAWKYSLELERNAMNNMSHSGILNSGTDAEDDWTLFKNLIYLKSDDNFFVQYNDEIEMLYYLDEYFCSGTGEIWARTQAYKMKTAFPPSICIDDDLDNRELYILGLTALYEIAVDTPGRINDAIPQDSKYRRIVH